VSVATATREPDAASQERPPRERAPRDFDRPRFLAAFTGLFYLVLFLPIAIVVLLSFKSERSVQRMAGLSLQWYETFFENASHTASFVGSLQIALVTTLLVTVVVRARLSAVDPEVEQAAMDLGATRMQVVRLVTLPALWPAIIAAALLVFALSFDDFVLSFFTTGASPGRTTLGGTGS
jgi:ABC-type spermidine/putrescine transport system permease subunit II